MDDLFTVNIDFERAMKTKVENIYRVRTNGRPFSGKDGFCTRKDKSWKYRVRTNGRPFCGKDGF